MRWNGIRLQGRRWRRRSVDSLWCDAKRFCVFWAVRGLAEMTRKLIAAARGTFLGS